MKTCPACGVDNAADARFCSSCGARLEAPQAAHEERRLVSVLFVDLVGSTAQADNADPEDVRETLRLYHDEAKRHIEQHGGVLEKFIGDAVMAVFGAPTAHGDDAERAVRAGLRVLSGLTELNRQHGLDLAARAAVTTGEAVVSIDGAYGDPLAMGDVVNTASRLQSAAPEGRLLVGAETYRASRKAIVYERHAAIDAKGKAEAVEAWLAVSPAAEEGDRRRHRTPLVGRSHELDLMHSAWLRCLDERRPHLTTVLGPPGIGKSRLCHEFSALVADSGGRILRGRCLPYEEQVGYQAFSRLASAAGGIIGSDESEVAREKLRAAVERLMPPEEAADTFRYLALLLGLAPDDSAPVLLLLFFAARRFLECVGLEQPTVCVFEDIHWAQDSEIALLEHLIQHLRDSPVMLVSTARPELLDEHPTWGAGLAAQTTIPLDPLGSADAAALAGQLLPGERDVDLGRVVETAGGNPLFLEELAASIAEAGGAADLPVTVRAAIAARVDALPADARAALLSGAVVGRTFWRGVVDALGGLEDVDSGLEVLEARDFVRRDPSSQVAGDAQFTFRHILIRDVAYAMVPRAVRRKLHGAVARNIEATVATPGATLATILAHHWREAGEPARAVPYLLAAADAARRSWAQDAVVDLYSAAFELAEDDVERRRIRLERCIALVEIADYGRAAEELAALVPELEGQQKLDALIALGHAYVWTERDEDVLATVEAAAALLPEVDDETARPAVDALESQGLAMRGTDGDLQRSFELGEQALERWAPGARNLSLRHQLQLHGNTAYWTSRYDRCLELSRQTRALAADIQSAEALLRGGGNQALALVGLGRHEEAIPIWDELLKLAQDHGRSPNVLLNYSAIAYRELYLLDEARRRSEEALELSANLAFSMPRQFAGSDLILTDLLRGDVGAAQAAWPARWEGINEATAWTTWLIAGRLAAARAEIALRAEPPESALEWSRRALEIARRTHRRKYEARSLTLLGQALTRLGRRGEALAALRDAVIVADELIGPPARWHARAALGEAAHELGDDETAAAASAEAAVLVEGFVATLAPERAAAVLAAEPVSRLLARR
ncbi:MAG TPA: adenylate/guanylate cyclase domain-containing protein [Gaiellaceae bacterium]|nr:adenylate/guanylate cyclase domain-containing protein [Gaiellaceae bacterium]